MNTCTESCVRVEKYCARTCKFCSHEDANEEQNITETLQSRSYFPISYSGKETKFGEEGLESFIRISYRLKSTPFKEYPCGDVFIGKFIILTAAHCIEAHDNNVNSNKELMISGGKSSSFNGIIVFKMVEMWIHPEYEYARHQSNVLQAEAAVAKRNEMAIPNTYSQLSDSAKNDLAILYIRPPKIMPTLIGSPRMLLLLLSYLIAK
ncbi:hypothetical protein M3Y94_01172800 [Aphelenchoides besseyi]|nr:hypothetical protein M3Y94_01172800 [Aphelenchoides besseyi]KAI6228171.1 hypothetical protein M3Y95_00594100 [Aphelenchoides besseyi]